LFKFKVVLIGDGAVGKSSLRRRFMGETFEKQYIKTIGADFSTKTFDVGGTKVKFIIWDLAGQPHFKQVRADFYRGARGALLVYDITRRETLEDVVPWMEEFLKNCGKKDVAVILIGNKIDLRPEAKGVVSTEEGMKMCELLRAKFKVPVRFFETSALTGENVDEAFYALALALLRGAGKT